MKIGALRHKVMLQRLVPTTEPRFGQVLEDWTEVATVWAEVLDLSGREFLASQEIHPEVSTKVRIRWRSDVEPAMRVVAGTRTLDIKAVLDPDGRRRELLLMCGEVLT